MSRYLHHARDKSMRANFRPQETQKLSIINSLLSVFVVVQKSMIFVEFLGDFRVNRAK